MRSVRAGIPPADRAVLAARAEARLLALPELQGAGTVLLFYSFGSEIPTGVLLRRLLERGRRVLLPYVTGEETMEAAEVGPDDPLEESGYGPKEPARRVAVDPDQVDAVVTPGLAFDRSGHRLGYGGGHYDRYLARLGPHAVRIGIGFGAQLVEEIPAEETDQRLTLVVTDEEVVRCNEIS